MATVPAELGDSMLLFLAGRPDDLGHFLALTGHAPDALRALRGKAHFRAGLLDYLLGNEPLLLAFCEETGHDPRRLSALGQRLAPWG